MKILVISVLVICSNFQAIVGKSANNNNLLIENLECLLKQTRQNVLATLCFTFNSHAIIEHIDAIFASARLNLTTLVDKNYDCARLTTTTARTSNNFFNYILI